MYVSLTSVGVFHDEVEAVHRLKAGVELDEEGRLVGKGEHPLLGHDTVDVVVLDNDVLFQDLDGVQLFRVLAVGEEHFAKAALAEHHQQIEVGELDRVRVVGSGGLGSVAFAIG